MPSSTGQLICAKCKSDQDGPTRPMLGCSSCKKGWHTYCHGPVITLAEYKAMYEAELNRNTNPRKPMFSNWRCSMCPTPSWDRSVVVISSDEEEITPQPRRNAAVPPNSASPAASTPVEDVIDLTEELTGLSSQEDKNRARGTSPPRFRSQTFDLSGWEEYQSPIVGMRLPPESQNQLVTPPPPGTTAIPSEPTIIIDEEVDLTGTGVGSVNPQPAATQPPKQMETRLLPQIIKEEMQELVIPPLAESERPRQPRKPKETKRFVPTSRKGKQRIKSFVDFHMPFGPETVPRVDLGTLEEALRKLGLE